MKGETRLKLKVSEFQTDISKDETKKKPTTPVVRAVLSFSRLLSSFPKSLEHPQLTIGILVPI